MTNFLIPDYMIRLFDADKDSPAIAAIVGEIWHGGVDALMEERFGIIGSRPWGHWTAQSVLNDLVANEARSFVVETKSRVVGFISYLIDLEQSLGTVGYNGVAPEHQGKGIGSAMLEFVLSKFKAAGVKYSAVIVADNEQHDPARHNYEKHGFRPLLGLHYMVQKL